jgi:hypothetical protein
LGRRVKIAALQRPILYRQCDGRATVLFDADLPVSGLI